MAAQRKGGRFAVAPKAERTVDGIVFASKGEAKRYGALKQMQRAKLINNLVLQPKFPVEIKGIHICTFSADFAYDNEAGETIIEDRKSSGTAKDPYYRLRKRAAEAYHGIKITEVE
jgi:hypothetical protein